MSEKHFKLVGIGVGPFNLSLAALLSKAPGISSLFLEQKTDFSWHREMMLPDAFMQTSYLKDLVTPVDPTSPYSYLNYLVKNGLFYAFMNTGRKVASRREFEKYCQWVSRELGDRLRFGTPVDEVRFEGGRFRIRSGAEEFSSDHLCVATGLSPRIPDCATDFVGPDLFHVKSREFSSLDLAGKNVVIVGGGQSGVEVFRNAFKGRWGRARKIRLVTRRQNLEPLDESAFANEYFSPGYVDEFWELPPERKARIVARQKLASDGNTPEYLGQICNDLFQLRHVDQDDLDVKILPYRSLVGVRRADSGLDLELSNDFLGAPERLSADVVILCTGFKNVFPRFLGPIQDRIPTDDDGRFGLTRSFRVEWDGADSNRIYALNFGRGHHGIAEPQTSLMSWRSATIVNDLLGQEFYLKERPAPNWVSYGRCE